MSAEQAPGRIEAIRQFNRFYTRKIGVLDEGLLKSPFSLTEVRVLYELSAREQLSATDLAVGLNLDSGYVSRLLTGLEKRGLIRKAQSKTDGRQSILSLTAKGRSTFAPLNERSRREVGAMIGGLPEPQQARLLDSMRTIRGLLGDGAPSPAAYVLRPHRAGDMGWIVHRHGVLYAQEYGWDQTFEAVVAGIVSEIIVKFNPKRERFWIAEREGEILGSIGLVEKSQKVAKLRLLLVEPAARGMGLGKALVRECIHFARQCGYRKITLWTQSNLTAARRIYEQAGFRLTHQEKTRSFGHDLVSETWDLDL